jgi:ABC-2 type transport system ATP-binding protein
MTSELPTRLPGPFAIATHDIVKRFGGETVLRGVNLQVPVGAVYALIGENGAGKSTTLKILLDLIRPTTGTAEVLGMETQKHGPKVRAQIGYVPEQRDTACDWMRLDRLLEHHAVFFPGWDHDYARRLVRRFDLQLDKQIRKLSKGQARRTQLILALAHRPRVLVLDEPTDGLDPVMRDETLALLTEHMADTETTTIISTHLVNEVDRLADHVGMMRRGQLVTQTSRDEMHRKLRRYHAEVPQGWQGTPRLLGAIAHEAGLGREMQWVVWGEENEVTAELLSTGAVVTGVTPVTLEQSTLALLRQKEMV